MTIYEIDKSIIDLIDENGEIKDFEEFEKLKLNKEEKIENTALYIKNLECLINGIDDEIKKLKDRKQTKQNQIDYLKNILNYSLNGEKFESAKCNVSYRKSTKCLIYNEEQFIIKHPEYVKTIEKQSISVADVKKALQTGEQIDGAVLEEKNNIQIK